MVMEAFIFEHILGPDESWWWGSGDDMNGQSWAYGYLSACSQALVSNQRSRKEDTNNNTKIRTPSGFD